MDFPYFSVRFFCFIRFFQFVLVDIANKIFDLSQELYKSGKHQETMDILETTLRMEGCDEELNSKAFYLIGWNYANDQGKLEKARAMYQRVVDSFSPGLKYVEKAEQRLAGYSLNDLAEAAYDNGRFGAALALREKVNVQTGSDIELIAKNQYLAGISVEQFFIPNVFQFFCR